MIETEQQLQNTIEKLARVEKYYTDTKKQPVDNAAAREQSLRALKRIINQFKEEIVRYRAGGHLRRQERGIQTDEQLENTRQKLRELEEHLSRTVEEPGENAYAKQQSVRSLKQTMNQLKEEITRYLARTKAAVKQ